MKTTLQKRLDAASRRVDSALNKLRAGQITRGAYPEVRAEYDALGRAVMAEQSADAEVVRSERAVEAGQLRWSEGR